MRKRLQSAVQPTKMVVELRNMEHIFRRSSFFSQSDLFIRISAVVFSLSVDANIGVQRDILITTWARAATGLSGKSFCRT